jgi:hypothetical protein
MRAARRVELVDPSGDEVDSDVLSPPVGKREIVDVRGLKNSLRKASGGLACGLPVVGGGTGGSGQTTFGIPTLGHGELLPLSLLLVLFLASAVVMFRRWGAPAAAPTVAVAPRLAVDAQEPPTERSMAA